MSKKKSLLPKQIYVKREFDQNDMSASWLNAEQTTDSMEDGDEVGVYELVNTLTLKVTRQLF